VQATIRSSMQPVMSCAGIKTYPRCAKFCTHDAVATCERTVFFTPKPTPFQPI
jgi:hypothetical protein